MIQNKSDRSLSPISKDQLSIGKFIRTKKLIDQNPETNSNLEAGKTYENINREKSPNSIGINTSRVVQPTIPIISVNKGKQDRNNQISDFNLIKPITHSRDSPSILTNSNKKQLRYAAFQANQNQQSSHFAINCNLETNKSCGFQFQDSIPSAVKFPQQYNQPQVEGMPSTPELPNRISYHSQDQNIRTSPIIIAKQFDERVEVGTIRHQKGSRIFSNSAPKDFGNKATENNTPLFSSPQLPSINKINHNIQGFRKFLHGPLNHSSYINQKDLASSNNSYQIGKKYSISELLQKNRKPGKNIFEKNASDIVRKQIQKLDPEQQQKLLQKKKFRISSHGAKQKLPTFRQQNTEQFEQQVNLQNPLSKSSSKRKNVNMINMNIQQSNLQKFRNEQAWPSNKQLNNLPSFSQDAEYEPGTLFSNSFIQNTVSVKSQNLIIVDLRTSIQKIKQALIEGGDTLAVSFNIPQVFYHPPTPQTSSQELHLIMLRVFSHVGINPQIVSIKKYINCVVMKDRSLCLMWNFSGKVYFGGWKKQQTMAEGNKDGVGIQWVPSRYIYYGQFKDNKKQGYGIMKKSSKEIYIGCWKNNQRWGWGKVYEPNGLLHQNGEFIQGCFMYERTTDYQLYKNSPEVNSNGKYS